MSRELYDYKRNAIKTAKELFYPSDVVYSIRNATTENEIIRILCSARNKMK